MGLHFIGVSYFCDTRSLVERLLGRSFIEDDEYIYSGHEVKMKHKSQNEKFFNGKENNGNEKLL
jgi:hypothetical protein